MITENHFNCCGCGNCAVKCPKNAITIKYNNEGFYKPEIDKSKCIKCNLCSKYCIIGKETFHLNKKSKLYIGYAKDNKVVLESSSGGIFRFLALSIISNGGYVSGPIFKDGILQHITTNDINVLKLMSGSKYLQSKINNTFSEIKSLLKDNKYVLFSGTPCQVASLKQFLQKDYDNLYTMDVLCHSVPSPKLFYNYVKELFNSDAPIDYCNFRDKTSGWHTHSLKIILSDGKEYINEFKNDKFYKTFLNELTSNTSCSECKFANTNRVGDITIGDAWCAQYLFKKFENKNGTSLLFINNKKGNRLFKTIKNNILLKKITKNDAICGNPILTKPFPMHVNRSKFFNEVFKNNSSVIKTIDKYLDISKNVGILNFCFENSNYGAVLTAFALNKFLNLNNFNAYNINYAPNWFNRNNRNAEFEKFKAKYIPSTHICDNFNDLRELNEQFSTFIVGSDQVFRPKFASDKDGIYYLNFVKNNKKKISCAASFGVDYYEGNDIEKRKLKYFLSKFNFISVREDSGVKIIKDIIDRPAYHLLDPVFLLNYDEYKKLFKNSAKKFNAVSYILNDEVRKFVNNLNEDIRDIRNGLSIEEWLETLDKTDLVITDSFHAICFSLIFNKPFVVLTHKSCPIERILSLFRQFNLDTNKILTYSNNDEKITFSSINNNIINPLDFKNYIDELRAKHSKLLLDNIKSNLIPKTQILINKKKVKLLKIKFKILTAISFGKLKKLYKEKLNRVDLLKKIMKYEKMNNVKGK